MPSNHIDREEDLFQLDNVPGSAFHNIDFEHVLHTHLEQNLERIVLSHLQTLDITAILQRILVANQQQILGQALRGISAEIFGGNYSNAMGHSTGQVMGHIVGALRNAFTKYL